MDTPNNVLGFDEVVDTIVDAIEIGRKFGDAISDGLDLSDLGTVFAVAPKFVEIYNDANLAYAQLLDLTPFEAQQAAEEIALRAKLPTTGVLGKVNVALNLMSRTYQEVMDDIDLIQDWKAFVASLKPADAADPN